VAVTAPFTQPLLAVAPDGRALVVMPDGKSMLVAERAPGGAFGPAVIVGEAVDPFGTATAVAIGPAGEASIAWGGFVAGRLRFVTRPAAGAAWTTSVAQNRGLLPGSYDAFFFTQGFLTTVYGGSNRWFNTGLPPALLTADGQAAVPWTNTEANRPALVSVPLTGGQPSSRDAGADIEAPGLLFAATLTDGTPALAWVESREGTGPTRLHLAAEGVVERPDPAPPRVTVGAPLSRRLAPKAQLRLPVSCSGPCEVRLRFDGLGDYQEQFELERAGRRVMRFPEAAGMARRQLRTYRAQLIYRTPGAKRARERTVAVRFARRGETPYAEVKDVRAARRGSTIRVTWALKGEVHEKDEPMFISATKTKARAEEPLALRVIEVGKRRRFSVTLKAGTEARFVSVRTIGFLRGQGRTLVRVR
jgi:hypothetical protein